MGKRKAVKDEEKKLPKEYEQDLDYFSEIHDELASKHKNEFVAVENRQVYSAKDPLKLLEILNENKINPRLAVIELVKDD